MIEYRDGTFGNIEELHKVLADATMIPPEAMRAIHVGTEEELKTRKTLEQRLSALEDELKNRQLEDPKSEIISIPKPEEVRKILRGQ